MTDSQWAELKRKLEQPKAPVQSRAEKYAENLWRAQAQGENK